MKRRFLTIYDYGMGGVWQYVHAESTEEITAKYPALEIVNELPAAMKDLKLREYDIDDIPDEVMAHFTKKP